MTKDELIVELGKVTKLPKSDIINKTIHLLQVYINDDEVNKKLWEINFAYNMKYE